ncbi:amino acid ABC transporter ATP-binding protein [Butyrivibrio sp. FCS014]|uniref:amino acid ABC transporter ATP-binding protein n=1 Tax=Butyrivibrio sp. FCS014 TaxID=1408304 RepID=UPI0004660B5C|nr:amino acid ABC transporter ATP-binding protein [Butyrivibrio sp. FCS014]
MIKVEGLSKSFNDNKVLENVDLTIENGEIVSIIGPSGTGKTTLLRCINYLERPDKGKVTIDDLTVDADNPSKKDIHGLCLRSGMVFQSYNLFHNKTVLENVMEAQVIVKKRSRKEARERALEELKKVGMLDWKDHYPSQLSGGQQQRVAIARAISMDPSILLLDEPTSALDPELTKEVQQTIRNIAKDGMTMLIVTHEIEFARELCNRIVFMDEGHIVEQGTPKEIFSNPKEERTKKFIQFLFPQDYQIYI